MRLIKPILLITIALGLTACGFQLRGQYKFDFDSLKLAGMEKTEVYRIMDLQLETNGLKVNEGKKAPLRLNLIREKRDRSVITFSASGRALEVRLTYDLQYSVTDKNGDYLIATTDLTQRRDLTYNDNQLLSSENEESGLYQEMEQDMARQIVTRLANLKVAHK